MDGTRITTHEGHLLFAIGTSYFLSTEELGGSGYHSSWFTLVDDHGGKLDQREWTGAYVSFARVSNDTVIAQGTTEVVSASNPGLYYIRPEGIFTLKIPSGSFLQGANICVGSDPRDR